MTSYTYRGWEVEKYLPPIPTPGPAYECAHRDYGGPGDARLATFFGTTAEIAAQIDELIEELRDEWGADAGEARSCERCGGDGDEPSSGSWWHCPRCGFPNASALKPA